MVAFIGHATLAGEAEFAGPQAGLEPEPASRIISRSATRRR